MPKQEMMPAPTSIAFSRWLQSHRDGMAAAEAAEQMQKLVQGVKAAGKAGTLLIAIKVRPASKGLGAFVIEDKVTVKMPELERPNAIYFADEENNLTRENPAQMTMELKTVAPTEAPLKQVNG